MRDGGVGEQAADIGLRERDEISDHDRQRRQRCQHRRPTGHHRVPCRAAMSGTEANEHDFSEHHERRDLRTRSDERRGRNRRALISVGRPKMERRGGDFETESDEGHDNPGGEQRLDGTGGQFLSDRGEAGRAAHAVDEAHPEKRECARRAAEEEIFQARFGGARVRLVERRHDVERKAGQLEPDEDHRAVLRCRRAA